MITKRQELILKTIIQDFTQKHDPVGSKTVMAQLPVKVSSATIRNEMVVLEEKGLLEKTHSSSGRVPSSSGYRYYLDHLVEPLALSKDVYEQIVCQLDQPFHQVNEIVQEAAKILSEVTNYTAFAEGPESLNVLVTGFQIVPLSKRQVMAILITNNGNVQNRVYSVAYEIDNDELKQAVKVINGKLVGKSLKELTYTAVTKSLTAVKVGHMKELLKLVEDIIKDAASEQMYVDGQINLLNSATRIDLKDLRSLYELVDHNELFSSMTNDKQTDSLTPIKVSLGSELPNELLKNYSLLTAKYNVGSYGTGTIAILGPTNMPYSQIIGLLEYFRNELAKKLLDYYGKYQ